MWKIARCARVPLSLYSSVKVNNSLEWLDSTIQGAYTIID